MRAVVGSYKLFIHCTLDTSHYSQYSFLLPVPPVPIVVRRG